MQNQEALKSIHKLAFENANPINKMVIEKIEYDGKVSIIEHSVIRRGFKIQYKGNTNIYELLNITVSDFYKYVDDKTIKKILKKGFVRFVDEEQVRRDRKKINTLNKKVEEALFQNNNSLATHWVKKRQNLINKISLIEDKLQRNISH